MTDAALGRVKVLIVDDLPRVREGLRTVLELEEDLEIAGEAADGCEAITLARRLRPDIVLMDLEMPELDGIEATRRIKQHDPAAGIIVLTIHSDSHFMERADAAGADAFIEKGSSIRELIEAIRSVWQKANGWA